MRRWALVLIGVVTAACGDTGPIEPTPEPAGLSPISLSETLHPRGVVDLTAQVVDADGDVIPTLTPDWTSSDPAVARIGAPGQAFGVAPGTVELTASLGGLSAAITAEVVRPSGGGDFRVWSDDGTVIAGTLDLPDGPGPHPVMVRIHGSGAVTRASGIFLANRVVPAGIGVLRYDKRGVGDSDGFYSGVGPANSDFVLTRLAEDGAAWLDFLSMHEDVVVDRLGVLGVSQGGWITPIIASIDPHARYMINVVGPTVTVGQQIHYQMLTGSSGQGQNLSGLSDAELARRVRDFDGLHGFDPAPLLREIEIPGLWILGTKDYLVPYENTTQILGDIVAETGKDYTVYTLPNGTHGTRDIATGDLIPWWDTDGGGFDWLAERGFYPVAGSAAETSPTRGSDE